MIYTFYSYKGGVGRSMALANVAECFCEQGLTVLMVDWDLEAPGLESFFFDPEPDDTGDGKQAPLSKLGLVQSNLGLIDLLTEYKRSYSTILPPQDMPAGLPVPKAFQKLLLENTEPAPGATDFASALDEHLPPLSKYIVPIHDSLSLLPAGWRYKERFAAYGQAVQAFDWDGLYANYRGKEFFDWVRSRLLTQAQVVLIDSRTGVTEMGGVCTRQMADAVVSFAAPNNQNMDGVARMVGTFQRKETIAARNDRKLDTIIVPTRVDPSELDDLGLFKVRFERLADERNNAPDELRALGTRFWDLQIPYRAKFSYQERRVLGPESRPDPTKGLETAYWKLACHLALLAPENSPIRQKFADRLQLEFPALLPKVVLSYMSDGANDAAAVRSYIGQAGIRLWPDLSHERDGDDSQSSIAVIGQAAHLVIVLSAAAAADTGPIRRELRYARQQGKTTIVLALSGQNPVRPWLFGSEVYTSLTTQFIERLRTASRAVRAPVMAPPAPPGYVERPELQQQIKSALVDTSGVGRMVLAIWGPGGSGKTATAARLCHDEDVIDAYPGGIFFLQATAADPALAILNAVAPDRVASDLPSGPSVAEKIAGSLLHGRRTLLIVDDVWSDKDVAPLLRLTDLCTVVVLTRDLKVATILGDQVISVGAVTSDEAARFLPDNAALADRLGRLPLTLTLARTALDQERTLSRSWAEAVEGAAGRLDRHGVTAFDRPGSDRNESVARSMEVTLDRLEQWERRRLEQVAALAFLGEIAFDQAERKWSEPSAPMHGEPRPLTRRHMEALCQKLSELALIGWEPKSRTISLPTLVREYFAAQGVIAQAATGRRKAIVSSSRDREQNQDVERARRILAGLEVGLDEVVGLAKRLKSTRYFSYARQLFARIRRMPEAAARREYFAQQHALCTYKDADLPYTDRADRALEILSEVDDLSQTRNQETLGLAGAIFKYKWAADGQRFNLERSLAYYLRGYKQGVLGDQGYTGINAAFVLDLIALQEETESKRAGMEAATATERRAQAGAIREDIVKQLLPGTDDLRQQWWFVTTIAEAYFGLASFDDARYWVREALSLEVEDWEFETTARQLARLAVLHNGGETPPEDSPAFHTLRLFLGNDANALRSIAVGKVGLALSGGGFRASLFHIGVLAKLAELDVLRAVEVLSCVSGGSIIGAHYYLEVKRLLETKSDEEITQQDYIELVQRIEKDFLAGIQQNLRTRLFANPVANLFTFVRPHRTLTDRLGELFERRLYRSAADSDGPLYLNDMLIRPRGEFEQFAPKLDNWHRAAKVPVLVLNATTLNTGHNWQFTATWMGEPPAGVMKEVDGNDLLRRMYYWEAPPEYRRIRLGQAVAASACVPGLFDPVDFGNLYPKRTIRLVDGGVHDNQGTGSLLEQECSVLLVSDASGQSSSQNHPGAEPFQVPLRASGIQGARVREAQFLDLDGRRRSSQIKALMFLHLKKDLDPDPVNWEGCIDPLDVTDDSRPKERRGPLTGYGILKTVQERLAAVRTDLDSFTDIEAFALMLSGYRMAEREFAACVSNFPVSNAQTDAWRFFAIEKAMNRAKDFEEANDFLLENLKASGGRAFKIWKLSTGFRIIGSLLVAVIAALVYEFWRLFGSIAAVSSVARFLVLAAIAVPVVAWVMYRIAGVRKPIGQLLKGVWLGTVGWTGAALHLLLFDPGFLAYGAVKSRPFTGPAGGPGWLTALAILIMLAAALLFNPVSLAYQAELRGDLTAARDHWSTVLNWVDAPEAYMGRGRAYAALGGFDFAIDDFGHAAVRMSNPSPAYAEQALASAKAGKASVAGATLERPIVPNARVYLLTGKPGSENILDDFRRGLKDAGFQVMGARPLVDPGRPDGPEVRYFHGDDRVQAERIARFVASRLSAPVPANSYKDATAQAGYLEIWLGRR